MHDCVARNEVPVDVHTLGRRDALGAEEDRGPYAQRLVDYGFEQREWVLAIVVVGIGEELCADGGHVVWVCGEVHEDEG